MQSVLAKAISLLTALLFVLPVVVWKNSQYPFIFYKQMWLQVVGLAIVTAYSIALLFYFKKYRPRWSWLGFAVFVFYAAIYISAVAGVDLSRSFWSRAERMVGLFAMLHYGLLFLVWRSVLSFEMWQKLWKIFLTIGSIPLVVALFQLVNPQFLLNIGAVRVASTLGNPIYTATFALFTLFSSIILWRDAERLARWGWATTAVLSVATLFATQTRGALIGLWAGALFALVWYAFETRKLKNVRRYAYGGIVALLLVPVLLLATGKYLAGVPLLSRFTQNPLGHTGEARLVFWKIAWEGWKQKKLFGWGWENFYELANRNYSPALYGAGDEWVDNAHNVILNTLGTAGIVGIVAYIGIWIALFAALFRKYSQKNSSEKFFIVTLGSLSIAYLVQNLFVFDTHSSYLFFFWLLAGVDIRMNNSSEFVPQGNSTTRKMPLVLAWSGQVLRSLIVLVLFFGAYFVYYRTTALPVKAERLAVESIKLATVDFKGAIITHSKAIKIKPNPYSHEISYHFGEFFLVWLSQHPDFAFSEYRRLASDMYSLGTDAVNFYLTKKPSDVQAMAHVARAYQDGYEFWQNPGYLDKSVSMYEKALEINPNRQSLMFGLAQTKILQDKAGEAVEILKRAVQVDPSIAQSHWMLALAYESNKEQSNAYEEVERALELGLKPNQRELVKIFEIYDLQGQAQKVEPFIKEALQSGKIEKKLLEYYREFLIKNYRAQEALQLPE